MRRAVRLTPRLTPIRIAPFGMIVRPSTDVSEIRQARATVLSVPSGPLRTASRRGLRPHAKSPSASHILRMKSTSYKVLLRRSDIFMSSSRRLRGGYGDDSNSRYRPRATNVRRCSALAPHLYSPSLRPNRVTATPGQELTRPIPYLLLLRNNPAFLLTR